jgi:small subunit ribosomal protein S6
VKEYELVVLYHPDLEVDMKSATDKVAKIIQGAKGEIVAEDDWGRRRLAYPIKKQGFAIYRVYTLQLPATAPKLISDILNITDEVLRFLLVTVDQKLKALIEEDKKRESERDEKDEKDDEETKEEE